MGRKKSLIPGFSLNRALGVTSAKQRFARATGIPTTKAGRKRKAQSYLWTAVAAGVCAAASGTKADGQRQSYAGGAAGEPRCCPYCGQELDGPTAQCPHCGRTLQQQTVQLRKPGPFRILLAVILSLMVISSLARKISPKPATGDVDGERLNVSNAAELAPDVQLNQNETILNANEPDGQRVLEKQESTAKAQDTKPKETVAPKEIEIPAEYPDPVRFTGSGDDVLSINCPDYPFAFYITGNSDSRHFSVITYDSDGNYGELLVNTSEPYSGFTFDPSQDVAKIEVSATGSWEIQLRSIYDVGSIAAGSSFNGVGDTVLLIRNCGDTARINGNAGGNHFAVWAYGADNDLLVNTTDVYNGTVMMPYNPVLLVVTAVGEWSVTLSE